MTPGHRMPADELPPFGQIGARRATHLDFGAARVRDDRVALDERAALAQEAYDFPDRRRQIDQVGFRLHAARPCRVHPVYRPQRQGFVKR